jgi:hypothetical protein
MLLIFSFQEYIPPHLRNGNLPTQQQPQANNYNQPQQHANNAQNGGSVPFFNNNTSKIVKYFFC